MAPVILVTFAGRQNRMGILDRYVRAAIDAGLIDEWHVWDFTRSPADHDWVTQTFGPVRYMASATPYQHRGTIAPNRAHRIAAHVRNDLHIALVPRAGETVHEIVVGGWSNGHSVVRTLPRAALDNFERAGIEPVWSRSTPGILSPGTANRIVLSVDSDGVPELMVNGVALGRWPEIRIARDTAIRVRGGWGADLELADVRAPIHRFIGNPGEQMPYWQAYDYYGRRLMQFEDALFLKCDDDIVFMELDRLEAFIAFRRAHPHFFVVSANVVNNGVCAYWQQVAGSIPPEVGAFERPPGGFGGSLWLSGERANRLHEHFLATPSHRLPLPSRVIEWRERQSINFIAWLGRDLVHMALPKCDDEAALTIDVPMLLNRPTAIFSDFMVSHLSFGPQEAGLAVDRLVEAYGELMTATLPR